MLKRSIPSLSFKLVEPYLKRVCEIGWVAQGELVQQFEDDFCKYLGLPQGHAIALSSGTAALFLALKVLGVKPREKINLATYTCSAALNAIFMAQAVPNLIDSRLDDFNCDYPTNNITIITHTFGVPCPIQKNCAIIEDAAAALGATINGKQVGTIGDIGVYSFYASKMITTGYGGMLVSKHKRLADKARDYRQFDRRKTYYPRFNFCMSDINAAFGITQLKQLPDFLKKRKSIAEQYISLDWPRQLPHFGCRPNNYEFVIRMTEYRIKSLQKHLKKKGIETIVPIKNYELLHNYLKLDKKLFPVAEELSRTTLAVPVYPTMCGTEINKVIRGLKSW